MSQETFPVTPVQNNRTTALSETSQMQRSQPVELKIQLPEPQLPANQLLRCQPAQATPEQLVCTTQSAIASPLEQLDTVTLVKTGGIPAAIILSIAVLILALAEYNKSFLPGMLQQRDDKTKPPLRRAVGVKNNIS